jgi:putative molybdopterin biosynthesis protein
LAIASGQADAGLGIRAAATALDLDFVPITWEDFDIVLSADAVAAAEPLISALRDSAVQSSLDNLGGYDLAKTGSVQFLS